MNISNHSKVTKLLLSTFLLFSSYQVMAEDIDIFVGSSGGTAVAPTVMIFLDNSSSDLFDAKLNALSAVLDTITATSPVKVGLSMWSTSSSPKGAYIRFAPRDMSVLANKTALKNILALIKTKNEYYARKHEPEALYEIYKFFSSLAPYVGVVGSRNKDVDTDGNTGTYPGATAFSQGLTSGFAFNVGNTLYDSVLTVCGKTYIVYMAANNNFQVSDVQGLQVYETTSAGPALAPADSNWGPEWARKLYEGTSPKIVTYVMDVATTGNSDAAYSAILAKTARHGGTSNSIPASSQATITTELLRIFGEIQSVNSTFASASLPISVTNRAQSLNQVFIPQFRPDPVAKPLWMGNLKKYQFILSGGDTTLGDNSTPPIPAINPLTGSQTECATSFWTTDSGAYWSNVPVNPSPASGCLTTLNNKFSDAPDGPTVEKGGTAEVIRKGNNPSITNTTPTWAVNRTIYTRSGASLTSFNTTSSGLSANMVKFIRGEDVNDENSNLNLTETRPSLHGDVVHSRPSPVNYGGTTGVTLYYGANDGMLHAVDATTGRERWAFIAPEHYSKFTRLMNNSPIISYPTIPSTVVPTPTPKDYFFDGSIGLYQNIDNTKVWIYPAMRRGGRMIYAIDVTNPEAPVLKWQVGCPNSANDTGCTTGFAGIGQTWSTPSVVANINGYTGPVLIVGGGYDGCEDADTISPPCSTPKGAGIYVIDADTGVLIKSFSALRSVAANVSVLATSRGVVDHAYAVDTGGNIYRLDFGNDSNTNWLINRVAYTTGAGRKFFYPPALLQTPDGAQVYLAIGSGDREHPLQSNYPYLGVINRFYVYRDNLASSTATNLDDTTIMKDFTLASTCSTAGILPNSVFKGFFMDLNQYGQGEQTVSSALIVSGIAIFSTNRPIPPAAGTCSTTLGEARGYWVNLFNGSGAIGVPGSCGGGRSGIYLGGGLPPSPVLSTVLINGVATPVLIGAADKRGGASSAISPQKIVPSITSKRNTVYWKSSGVD